MLKTKSLCYFLGAIMTLNIYAKEFSWKTTYSEDLQTQNYQNKMLKEYFPFFKNLYENNNPSTFDSSRATSHIPKVIHQIWLGSPLPERYIAFQNTWITLHPNWEYKLWTETDLKTFNLKNRIAFDQAANYAEKANIWRYEILERFGGLYIDTDFECLKPFDEFVENYEFFAGLSVLSAKGLINNALIGCIPNHPIIKKCVSSTNKLQWKDESWGAPQFYRNGILFFARTIYETAQELDEIDLGKMIVFPPSIFFPETNTKLETLKRKSYAIHYSDKTWKKKKK